MRKVEVQPAPRMRRSCSCIVIFFLAWFVVGGKGVDRRGGIEMESYCDDDEEPTLELSGVMCLFYVLKVCNSALHTFVSSCCLQMMQSIVPADLKLSRRIS